MASWKKIIVSGSQAELAGITGSLLTDDRILQAKNDGAIHSVDAISVNSDGHLDGSFSGSFSGSFEGKVLGTIDSASVAVNAQTASVADRATTLSSDATASFADRATSASIADELSQEATASFALNAESASVAARATTLSSDATASFADRATTASFADLAGALRTGATASFADRATSASIADELSQLATASIADTAVTASHVVTASHADTAASSSYALTASVALNVPATASHADRATSASIADLASTLSDTATASFADSATTASIADLASTLSGTATASFADLAGTVHDGNITTAKIADGDVTNIKLANDSVTIGTTEIDLGTTATTIAGLTEISATTGSFVLQVFESSSTIITSGSNIFGDKETDIQQFTGSILQTGSMQVTGSIHSERFSGSFSGSFEGDGSGLTGLATSLTVDGDTGTEDVDLVQDDLQILGTSEEIETAVTKVGNDIRVTLGLPDSITVTASLASNAESASVAARATTLSSDATASFADRATSASIADELSQLATASIADTAVTASHVVTASFADSATSASIADTATSASATIAGNLFPSTQGLEGQTIALDSSGDFIYADLDGTGSTKKLNQTVAAQTWSFAHNLAELYPIIQVYDDEDNQLIPERVEAVDANNAKLYFSTNTSGVAAAMVGGMGITASLAVTADTASVATRANGLTPTVTASFADSATTASIADLASTLSDTATASFADSATTASHVAGTASIADDATTASFAETGDGTFSGSFSGSFVGDGSGLTGVAGDFNFQGDSGATTINLLTETASFLGTANEIVTAVTDDTLTISLPDDVTIGNNLTVTTDLSVNGDAVIAGDLTVGGSLVSASSLEVADQFIILASGSTSAIDGGIIVNQTADADGKGQALAYDASADRWALETGLNDTASAITPDAYVGVIQESAGAPGSDPVYGGTSGLGTIFVDTSANDAYIYI